jgi:hypothetical protein
LARPGAMASLSHFFLELIKHKVVYLISALSMVWDRHFNLLEPIWMHKIVAWSFFVFYYFAEKQAVHAQFQAPVRAHVHAFIWLIFFWVA